VEMVVERVAAAPGGAGGWTARGTSERFLPVLAHGRGAAPPPASRLRVSVTEVGADGLAGRADPTR